MYGNHRTHEEKSHKRRNTKHTIYRGAYVGSPFRFVLTDAYFERRRKRDRTGEKDLALLGGDHGQLSDGRICGTESVRKIYKEEDRTVIKDPNC